MKNTNGTLTKFERVSLAVPIGSYLPCVPRKAGLADTASQFVGEVPRTLHDHQGHTRSNLPPNTPYQKEQDKK